MLKKRTVEEINKRICTGKATIMTADELKAILKTGESVHWSDVDVITSATCGLMSGTIAVLSFPITGRGEFTRAQDILLNGVPGYPGPCPNERLGVVDLIVYGTSHSIYDPKYGGGHLFKDIISEKAITVKVRSKEGKKLEKEVTIKDMGYARLQGIRNCYRNYIGMINRSKTPVPSIFHVFPIKGPYKELSVCGCGALNPLALDPGLVVIGVGTKILINDAVGYITGLGTRASVDKPNLAGFADMHEMDPFYMGGFWTAEGPEVINSWAVPIPILDQQIFDRVCITDAQEPLPIADISDRIPFMKTDYGQVWTGTDHTLKFSSKACTKRHEECKTKGLLKNDRCIVEEICPVGAFKTMGAKLDRKLCFNCGACVNMCEAGCFKMNLGAVEIDNQLVPITLRQSDRARAIKLAKRLKSRMENGLFLISSKVESLL